ncbi:MAG: replicative DNA helicase [Deltaproteobacteria bacterium]|jgi:replicative DNA helicase|nr:replicative DNA helicase [Deltaproteobacteria bacterium]
MTDIPENNPARPSLSQPDLEVERCILGAMMANWPDALPQVLESNLKPDDFYKKAHGEIYRIMIELYNSGNPVDQVAVYNALSTQGMLSSIGGGTYLSELYDLYGVPENVGYYAKLIIDRAILRCLAQKAAEISEKCRSNPQSVQEVLDEAEGSIYKIREERTSGSLQIVADHMNEVFDKITDMRGKNDALSGVPTGFTYLDRLTGGFQPTDMIVLGGRPGMGKTSLALTFALNVAISSQRESRKDLPPLPVAVFSLEMSTEQLIQRLMCQIGHHDLLAIRSRSLEDDEIQKLTISSSKLRQAPIFIDETAAIRPIELRAKARRLQSQLQNNGTKLGLIVIDYLQLMRPNGRHNIREQEISEISGSLKSLAKELKVTILTLSQLKRSDEKDPSLSDLRESGAIEQDADMVLFVVRKDLLKNGSPEFKGDSELYLRKHRNGPTGMIKLRFIDYCSTFEPCTNFYSVNR